MEETDLQETVKELLPVEGDRDKLFDALRRYQSGHNLQTLLTDLRVVLDEPDKLGLYEFLRPLILLRHQIPYSRYTPPTSPRLRAVRLVRRQGESLGFAVRGGFEYGVGIFVTDVAAGSQAERQGLRVGDEIVRVNGFTIHEGVHDDVLRLIKARSEIVLKVKEIGMVPLKEESSQNVQWKYTEDLSSFSDDPNQEMHSDRSDVKRPRDLKIFIDSTGHQSVGCSIRTMSGPSVRFPGIFIEHVHAGGLADEVGLTPGDQLLEVNHTSFRGITLREALLALKSSRQLNFVIRKNSLPLPASQGSQPSSQPDPNHALPAQPAGPIQQPHEQPPSAPQLPSSEASATTEKEVEEALKMRPAVAGAERSVEPPVLDEAQIIQHQLDMRALRRSLAASGSTSTVVSTSAQVHSSGGVVQSRETSKSSPLSGAAAARLEQKRREDEEGKASNSPRLLELEGEFGWSDRLPAHVYQKFSIEVLDGRPLNCLTYRKTSDLGIAIEGGVGSPLGGKIMVSIVFDDGIAKTSGKLKSGDQLLMLNGHHMTDITVTEAQRLLDNSLDSAKDSQMELIYCKCTLVNEQDSVTFF